MSLCLLEHLFFSIVVRCGECIAELSGVLFFYLDLIEFVIFDVSLSHSGHSISRLKRLMLYLSAIRLLICQKWYKLRLWILVRAVIPNERIILIHWRLLALERIIAIFFKWVVSIFLKFIHLYVVLLAAFDCFVAWTRLGNLLRQQVRRLVELKRLLLFILVDVDDLILLSLNIGLSLLEGSFLDYTVVISELLTVFIPVFLCFVQWYLHARSVILMLCRLRRQNSTWIDSARIHFRRRFELRPYTRVVRVIAESWEFAVLRSVDCAARVELFIQMADRAVIDWCLIKVVIDLMIISLLLLWLYNLTMLIDGA